MNKIIAIPAFKDNYIWAIHSLEGSQLVVVDPGSADPVLEYLQTNNLTLSAILVTHHHWDHSGGVVALLKQFPNIQVYGPANEKVEGLTKGVKENDVISLEAHQLELRVIDIPGHTLGHIAFVGSSLLFCGDTLFSCGCGRIFEGTPNQMYHSLEKIKNLSKNTLVYCGHEYTLANIAFAQTADPHNKALAKRLIDVQNLRAQNLPSLPVSLQMECETNPFLRCEAPEIVNAVQNYSHAKLSSSIDIFAQLREWKNNYKS